MSGQPSNVAFPTSLVSPDGSSGTGTGATSSGGGGSVTSVYGRAGVVVAAAGDYAASLITNVAAGGITAVTVQAAINELDTGKIGESIYLAKGDLLLATAASTPTVLPIGATDGMALLVDSSSASGAKWGSAALDFPALASATAIADADYFAFYDVSGSTHTNLSMLLLREAAVDGATAMAATPALLDTLLVWDTSASVARKATLTELRHAVGAEAWVSGEVYEAGKVVFHAGRTYVATAPHTAGTFSADAAQWSPVNLGGIEPFAGAVFYPVGAQVLEGIRVLVRTVSGISAASMTAGELSQWSLVGQTDLPGWSAASVYAAGEQVSHAGKLYARVLTGTSGAAFDAVERGLWAEIGEGALHTQILTDAATIAWDAALGERATVTLTADRAVGVPTGIVAGRHYHLSVSADASDRQVTFPGSFIGVEGAALPAVTIPAGTTREWHLFALSSASLVEAGGGGGDSLTVLPAAITVDPAPGLLETVYPVDTSGAAFTYTLPPAPADGSTVIVYDAVGSLASNNLTLSTVDSIRGGASYVCSQPFGYYVLRYHAATSEWVLLTGQQDGPDLTVFNATTDWGTASGGVYTLTVARTQAQHTKGLYPSARVQFGAGPYTDGDADSVSYTGTGDVTITLTALEAPDGRSAGRILITD